MREKRGIGHVELVLSFVITVIYAALDEFHQSFIPGREPKIRDVVIDSIGSISAILCLSRIKSILE